MNIYEKYSLEKFQDPDVKTLEENLPELEEDILEALGDYGNLLWNVGKTRKSRAIMNLYAVIGSLNPTNS
tara:strand:+ start:1278 stop:1487 length:210 start_codon:yes stop_codon:yes gene_type:complete